MPDRARGMNERHILTPQRAMNATFRRCLGFGPLVLTAAVLTGCALEPTELNRKPGGPNAQSSQDTHYSPGKPGEFAKVPTGENEKRPEPPNLDPTKPVLPQTGKVRPVGKNVFIEILPGDKRRVL